MAKAKDLTGQRFERLTVVERVGNNRHNQSMWKCLCDCGNIAIVNARDLRNGHTKSCGCLHKGNLAKDMTGQRFGRLVVIEKAGVDKEGKMMWLCKCDCGKEKVIVGKYLRDGNVKSCGCWKVDAPKERETTHGLTNTTLYKKWKGMKTRCNNPNGDHSRWYYEKKIKVCEEWNDFKNFYKWAMENGYRDDLSIERIDINKGYEPSNCKWITMREQARNKSNSHWITYNGKTQTLAQWAEETGLPYDVIQSRVKRYHWPIERALTEPVNRR